MAGHSKWANIKHKKAKEDASRGKAFTKLSKEITIVAKEGGGDPAGNPRLRTLLEKAKYINMPGDNVKRAIQKGTGELPGVSYEHHMYEGYGPGGIAVIVEVLTDNKNRAVAELRHVFSKKGGNLSEAGSVGWMFEQKGIIKATGSDFSEDDLLEKLIDYDIENIEKHEDDLFVISCPMKELATIKEAVQTTGLKIEEAEIEFVAKDSTELDEAVSEKAIDFLHTLEALDDVQNIYSNLG
jgi:YebC/PmpR family DNA-binding regulatory protein